MTLPLRARLILPVALAALLAAPAAAQSPKRVLLVTHSGGFIHNSVGTAEDVLKEIGPKNGLDVTCYRYTGDPKGPEFEKYQKAFRAATGKTVEPENCGRVNAATLKNFDCVLFFTTGSGPKKKNIAPLTPDEVADLTAWVKAGGAFCGTHCAVDTLYDDSPYGDLIGGYFKTHPPGLQTVKVKVDDPKHPAAAAFPAGMEYKDEIYIMMDQPYSRGKVNVILSAEPGSFTPKNGARADGDYALAWSKEYGKGKVFYTAFGHDKKVWQDPRFQQHLLAGMKWAMGAK
ncbi:MAG: ThuA domain-containing protein [Gemmataceae bacterium]